MKIKKRLFAIRVNSCVRDREHDSFFEISGYEK